MRWDSCRSSCCGGCWPRCDVAWFKGTIPTPFGRPVRAIGPSMGSEFYGPRTSPSTIEGSPAAASCGAICLAIVLALLVVIIPSHRGPGNTVGHHQLLHTADRRSHPSCRSSFAEAADHDRCSSPPSTVFFTTMIGTLTGLRSADSRPASTWSACLRRRTPSPNSSRRVRLIAAVPNILGAALKIAAPVRGARCGARRVPVDAVEQRHRPGRPDRLAQTVSTAMPPRCGRSLIAGRVSSRVSVTPSSSARLACSSMHGGRPGTRCWHDRLG